jgi:RNA polymerase sigma-70 factor (ECF subfamily)
MDDAIRIGRLPPFAAATPAGRDHTEQKVTRTGNRARGSGVTFVRDREARMSDRLAFDEFYLGTRLQLLRQLTVMTGDGEQAADVLQEAYARAWQRWRRVSNLADPAAWVRTVAWRVAISQHRRSLVAADRLRRLLVPEAAVDRTPDRDEALDLRAALRLLSPEHRRALVLYEMCGLSVPQVAAETGVAEGTVKSRLARARTALAVALGPDYPTRNASAPPVEGRMS